MLKNPISHYHAMIEAMDTEIGRLFKGVGAAEMANTHVIFIGDNGTPNAVVQSPVAKGKSKGTLYQGGIRVPMVIAGPAVAKAGRTQGLVHVLDVFATVLDFAGLKTTDLNPDSRIIDSVSLRPYLKAVDTPSLRGQVMSELFDSTTAPNGKTIRDATHKLVRYEAGGQELFDLSQDPWEAKDLWADPSKRSAVAVAKHKALSDALDAYLATEKK